MAIFPNVSEQKEDEIQVGPLTEVTKKDLQITAFHIKAGDQKVNYTVRYTISQSLYNKLEKEQNTICRLFFQKKFKN